MTVMSVCWCVQLMLIIDSREKYSNTGKDRADGLAAKIQVIRDRGISVDVRMLEQGDVLWIAHSRYLQHLHIVETLFHCPQTFVS
jgi:ERCC4-type nuclease